MRDYKYIKRDAKRTNARDNIKCQYLQFFLSFSTPPISRWTFFFAFILKTTVYQYVQVYKYQRIFKFPKSLGRFNSNFLN